MRGSSALAPTAIMALMASLTLSACGPEHALEGSLTEVVDLTFTKVDVQRSEDELAVRFLRPQGIGDDVVLRVSAGLLGTAVDANNPIDLAESDPVGNQRGRVTRNVLDDPLTDFPELERGELVFHKSVISGKTIPGEFHLTFARGTKLANGRTVFGTFEAKVQ